MEGHLHGVILLAILLTCLAVLWRWGRQPKLAFPIFLPGCSRRRAAGTAEEASPRDRNDAHYGIGH